jgi:hypothetical protein
MPTKTKSRKTASKTSKRTLIEPHKGDKRYVRRNKKGQFKDVVDVGRSSPPIGGANPRRKSNKARAIAAT